MSGHLTDERITAWLAGERKAEDTQHLRECPECAGAVERIAESLGLFRAAMWRAGESANVIGCAVEWKVESRPSFLRWSIPAAALAMVLLFVPLYQKHAQHLRQERQDAALLDEVNAEVSRAVPAPFEKLWGAQ